MSTHTPERLRCEVCDMPTLGDTLCNLHYEEQEKMTHTPGPWNVKPYLTPELDEDPIMVYEVIAGDLQERFNNLPVDENEEQALDEIHAENEANAAFIVRACNSHEAMLEALKRFAQAIKADNYDQDLLVDIYHDVREAIRLAEGRG